MQLLKPLTDRIKTEILNKLTKPEKTKLQTFKLSKTSEKTTNALDLYYLLINTFPTKSESNISQYFLSHRFLMPALMAFNYYLDTTLMPTFGFFTNAASFPITTAMLLLIVKINTLWQSENNDKIVISDVLATEIENILTYSKSNDNKLINIVKTLLDFKHERAPGLRRDDHNIQFVAKPFKVELLVDFIHKLIEYTTVSSSISGYLWTTLMSAFTSAILSECDSIVDNLQKTGFAAEILAGKPFEDYSHVFRR